MAQGNISTNDGTFEGIENLTIKQIREKIAQSSVEELKNLLIAVKLDSRKGVVGLESTIQNKLEEQYKKMQKKNSLLEQERILWSIGYQMVAGVDEAGRGPLAGPVIAACVIFPRDVYIEGVDDSKKLSPAKRAKLFDEIMDKAVAVGIGRVGPEEIDKMDILNATREAMRQAVLNCSQMADILLTDAVEIDLDVPCIPMIKGDQKSHSIAAASIIAKVTRDREMCRWHEKYPVYGFDKHKGYGTAAHIEAIRKWGLCSIHRRSFAKKFTKHDC